MQVYKTFLKIIKRNSLPAFMYLAVFLIIAVVMSNSSSSTDISDFKLTKVRVAIINNDGDTNITRAINNILKEGNEIVKIENNKEAMQDALFFRHAEYIAIIPENFTEDFINKKDVKIEKLMVPDSNSGVYLDMKINSFLNSSSLYNKYLSIDEIDFEKIASGVTAEQIKVNKVNADVSEQTSNTLISQYFTFGSYILIAIILYCVSGFVMKFNAINIKERTECSPTKKTSINFQILCCLVICSLIIFIIFSVLALFVCKEELLTQKGILYLINLFIYIIFCTSFAYLIGSMTKNLNALSGIVNTISLAFSFLGGAFVPQDMLGDSVKVVGSFTPTFWYIKSCGFINNLNKISFENLNEFIINNVIVLAFSVAILVIGLVLTKQRKKNS